MNTKHGPPKHQNKYAWKPNAGHKINESEVGSKCRPYSEITGVCARCKEQIEWKRRYGKYKPLTEPPKDVRSGPFVKLTIVYVTIYDHMETYGIFRKIRNLGCAKEQGLCAKCCSRVSRIIGRDSSEVEAEEKMLQEAIKNARERDRRTLLRTMNKGKSSSLAKTSANKETETEASGSEDETEEEQDSENNEDDKICGQDRG